MRTAAFARFLPKVTVRCFPLLRVGMPKNIRFHKENDHEHFASPLQQTVDP